MTPTTRAELVELMARALHEEQSTVGCEWEHQPDEDTSFGIGKLTARRIVEAILDTMEDAGLVVVVDDTFEDPDTGV